MDALQTISGTRCTKLLNAAARVAQSVKSILDLDLLLRRTIDIICTEFDFCYTGIFLVDQERQWAVLRAAPNVANAREAKDRQRLPLDGDSLVARAIRERAAQTAELDETTSPSVPDTPPTRTAMALPLQISGETLGALLVERSDQVPFSPADELTLHIIADQLAIAINNSRLHHQMQELLYKSVRRARLLGAANTVGHGVASIMELDELLPKIVDILCDTYGFYYAGVFLVDESEQSAILSAGHGEAGQALLAKRHKLPIDNHSMVGAAILKRQARISLDVDEEDVFFRNPHLPETRSEIALPLTVGEKVLGAVTVQSTEERAFSVDDVTTLQTMADYLSIAIHNAQVLQELEEANAELVRSKTFEMIATATAEAIHWVGNKAAPLPGSVVRITEDLTRYIVIAHGLLADAPPALREHKFAQMLEQAAEDLAAPGIDLSQIRAELERQPLKQLRRVLSIESIFEDLSIIQAGAKAILNIKEDLVGPARKRNAVLIHLSELIQSTVASMGIPKEVARMACAKDLPPVRADRRQLERVFINLIKNAIEAMESVENKKLFIWARPSIEPGMVEIEFIDNGVGIPPEEIDKIWVAFYTTKGDRGGTGLGLAACLEIIKQSGGKIRVESQVGEGTTFTVSLPAAKA